MGLGFIPGVEGHVEGGATDETHGYGLEQSGVPSQVAIGLSSK